MKEQIEEMAKALLKLTYDLRTNMTAITRYVKHEKSKSPTLTDGQFIDRHLKYRELAIVAVDNILKCINGNEELRQIENMCFEETYRKKSEGEWLGSDQTDEYICSLCGGIAPVDCEKEDFYKSNFCPNCGAKMKGGE